MNWESLRAAKQSEILQLAGMQLSEATPSIRSFAHFVTTHKQNLALIAALKRADPRTGCYWFDRNLVALAQECDNAEVGAIAVYTEPTVFGASLADLQAIATAVSAPVLRLDLILHASQIHHARLCGADAVLLSAGAVDATLLASLMHVASSMHVAPVVAVQTRAEIEYALAAGAFILGISSPCGTLDLAHLETLAAVIPAQRTVVVLDEISSSDDYAALQGKVDAVLVSNTVLATLDPGVVLAELVGR